MANLFSVVLKQNFWNFYIRSYRVGRKERKIKLIILKLIILLRSTTELLWFTICFPEGLKLGSVAEVLVMFVCPFDVYLVGI